MRTLILIPTKDTRMKEVIDLDLFPSQPFWSLLSGFHAASGGKSCWIGIISSDLASIDADVILTILPATDNL